MISPILSGTITSVDGASVKALHDAICAAQSLFDTLKDIPVPGHFDVCLTARAGLHAGNVHTPNLPTLLWVSWFNRRHILWNSGATNSQSGLFWSKHFNSSTVDVMQ